MTYRRDFQLKYDLVIYMIRNHILRRFLKYMIILSTLIMSMRCIPNSPPTTREILVISAVGASAFALLDMCAPTVSANSSRSSDVIH